MTTARKRRIAALLKLCGAPQLDPALIEPAFVHESAANERGGASNERLEFFGDAILGFVAARWVVDRYPEASEGELHRRKAALVSGEACAETARRLGFSTLIELGVGARKEGGAHSSAILADAFEAFVAALYRHADLDRTARFLEREHLERIDRADADENDPKSMLQEFAQAHFATFPLYIERAEGPPQDRRYTSQVRIRDEVLGEGIGPSKKAAQQSAAAMALARLRARHPEPPTPPEPRPSNGRVIALRRRGTPENP